MSGLLASLISGIAHGVPLFLVASGLSLIYGVVRVLNFAHGSLFVVGALLATTAIGSNTPTLLLFAGAMLLGFAVVGVLGLVMEFTVIRRLYSVGHIEMLLATFALLLLIEGAAEWIWGINSRSIQEPTELSGNVQVLGATIPVYDLLLVAVGAVVAVLLAVLIGMTRFGRAVRAIAQDSTMAQAIGLNSRRTMWLVFGLGAALAGVAGALIAPNVTVAPSLGHSFVLQSFAVVIIGGLGSIPGSLVAAILVGVAESLAITYVPQLSGLTFYILVLIVLLVRPQGILGNARLGAH